MPNQKKNWRVTVTRCTKQPRRNRPAPTKNKSRKVGENSQGVSQPIKSMYQKSESRRTRMRATHGTATASGEPLNRPKGLFQTFPSLKQIGRGAVREKGCPYG